jgi:hypothetical protein
MKAIAAGGLVPQSVADRSADGGTFSPHVPQRAIIDISAMTQYDARGFRERARRTVLESGRLDSFIRNITGGGAFARRSHPMVETQAG